MMHERVVEAIGGYPSVPLFIGALMAFFIVAVGISETVHWWYERRRR